MMKNYKKSCQNESMSGLKLAMIITGSIVAAAGIILLLTKFCKKKHPHKLHECCCSDSDAADSWDIDEDVLSELELDDEEMDSEEDEASTESDDDEPATDSNMN